jgi:uracil-DNA glycosylase
MDLQNLKQQKLTALYEKYQNCLACPLGNLGRTTIVFGQGNPDAKLMFVGEGPGQDEDQQGKPFVGKSGKLLDRLFRIVGIYRQQVFITNIVKCRPPNNRKPTNAESSTCKKLLLFNQIEIIQPKIICTLGASALEGLLGQPIAISAYRGKPMAWQQGITIVPTFHPAYILRSPSNLDKIVDDLLLVYQLTTTNTNRE